MVDSRKFFRPLLGLSDQQRADLRRLLANKDDLVERLNELARNHLNDVDEFTTETILERDDDRRAARGLLWMASKTRKFAEDVVIPLAPLIAEHLGGSLTGPDLLGHAEQMEAAAARIRARHRAGPRYETEERQDLAWRVHQELTKAGIKCSKSADGVFAKVLTIVCDAAGVTQPEDLYRVVASVIQERRRRAAPVTTKARPASRAVLRNPRHKSQPH